MKQFLKQLMPLVIIGMIIVALIFGIMLLAYLFIFGAILGLLLYIARWIRDKFFTPKKPVSHHPRQKGRIIESDDWKKL